MTSSSRPPTEGGCANPNTCFLKSEKYVLLVDFRPEQSRNFKSYQKDETNNLFEFSDKTSQYSIPLLIADYFYFCPCQAQLLQ